jgi:hypothetical protein
MLGKFDILTCFLLLRVCCEYFMLEISLGSVHPHSTGIHSAKTCMWLAAKIHRLLNYVLFNHSIPRSESNRARSPNACSEPSAHPVIHLPVWRVCTREKLNPNCAFELNYASVACRCRVVGSEPYGYTPIMHYLTGIQHPLFVSNIARRQHSRMP